MNIILIIRNKYFEYLKSRAIKKANKLNKITKYKFLVIRWNKGFKVIAKKDLKKLYYRKKFKKTISLDKLINDAVYCT